MDYAIGDTVVHWTHGLGKVIAIQEKYLAGVKKDPGRSVLFNP
jgi:RNA polymerase-interacting CarD/CdnL/TRCF family regulator